MSDDTYLIYQLKDTSDMRILRFEPLDSIKAAGQTVEWGNYNHIYTGVLEAKDNSAVVELETVFVRFNNDHSQDFTGHSLSTSDIVVLCHDGQTAAYYVDSFDYVSVPEFMDAPYKYYSMQRPVDIATYPITEGSPASFINFDKREWCENATFRAWGYLAYNTPLTQKQIDDYELRAASGNPDHIQLSPYQLEAQTQIVGKWEKAHHVSEVKRLTWWHSDYGVFIKKDWITNELITERFRDIAGYKSHAVEKKAAPKRITEQLADAEKHVDRKGDSPTKNKYKSYEDR
jgi:hypothetical protein